MSCIKMFFVQTSQADKIFMDHTSLMYILFNEYDRVREAGLILEELKIRCQSMNVWNSPKGKDG